MVGDGHPGRVKGLLTYPRLIVREAQRNGGDGWKHYDGVFRKVAAANPLLDWSQPMASLYSTTFLANRTGAPAACVHCLETDQPSPECALSPVLPSSSAPPAPRSAHRASPCVATGLRETVDFSARPICRRWNNASCRGAPGCTYRHACAGCGRRGHKVGDYPDRAKASATKDTASAAWLPSSN